MTNLWRNLRKMYAYKFLGEAYLIAPILIPYYVACGLSATQVFLVQATFHLSMLVLEIPSGYLADVVGRKRTLLLGALFLPIGLAVYTATGSFLTFVAAEALLAVSAAMRSGCDSALIYDTLRQMKREKEYKKIEGRTFLWARLGTAIASIGGSLAALISLRFPFFCNIGTTLPMIPISATLKEPDRPKIKPKNPLMDILGFTMHAFRHRELRLLIVLASLIMTSGIIGIWGYFLLYESGRIPLGLYGVLFALSQLASALGSQSTHRLAPRLKKSAALLLPALMGIGFISLGLIPSPLFIPMILLNMFLWGYSYPLILDEMNRRISSEVRATLLSVAGMSGNLTFVILSPMFGRMIDATSISMAFISLGAFFLLAFGLTAWLYLRQLASSSKKNIPPA